MESREPRPEKVKAVEDLTERLKESGGALFTDYRGMTVKAMGKLRNMLRDQGASCFVVKNTLMKRAAAESGISGLEEWLDGPTAVIFLGEELVGQTKALVDFAKDNLNLPAIKGGFVEGRKLGAASVLELAKLPPREILLAALVVTLQAPMSGLLGTLQAPMVMLAATLKGLSEKKSA
jgi:large subunit ribosomal protein L10